jgi:hypothetical protein
MEYGTSDTVVCVDKTKDACLYFNEVIPLNLGHLIPWEGNNDLEVFDVLKAVLPPSLKDSTNPTGLSWAMLKYVEAFINVYPMSIGIAEFSDLSDKATIDNRARTFFPILMHEKDNLINTLPCAITNIYGANIPNPSVAQVEDPAFILTGLNVVDTSKLMWKHIIELRQDKESVKKLRRLRTFIYENYQNKPATFIKDDLLNRIDSYEDTTKKWALKTTESVFKIIFKSGSAVAATAATIASIFSGISEAISLPLGIGTTFLIGTVGLEITSYKRDLQSFKQENPITYLLDVKNSIPQ